MRLTPSAKLMLVITLNTVLVLAFVTWFYRWEFVPISGGAVLGGAYAHDRWTGKTYLWNRMSKMGEVLDYAPPQAPSPAVMSLPPGFEIVPADGSAAK